MNPELQFVAACCRWPDDEIRRSLVRDLAARSVDWKQVAALTAAHRVEGLVRHCVRTSGLDVPSDVLTRLDSMADQVRIDALTNVAETLRLCAWLRESGIEHRILKGLPVAAIAYGNVGMKNSADIDLLVHPKDAVRTATLLLDSGYRQERPWRILDEREFDSWSSVAKEACFVGQRAQVDLHWDLLDQPALLSGVDPWAAPREVPILGNATVPTLGDAANLAYLASHGAFSGWSRLKWLADFSSFLFAYPPEVREELCAEARAMTGGRPVDQGLLLAKWLFGGGLPAPREQDLRAVTRLAQMALQIIESRQPDLVLEQMRRPMRVLRKSQKSLRADAKYRRAEARRRWKDEEIRFRLRWPLPPRLQWLYRLLRIPGAVVGRAALLARAN